MKLAIRITATQKRLKWANIIREMLGDPRLLIHLDTSGDLWTGAKTTLQSYNSQHTHMLVLQDDILPCKDFIPTVERLIELLPDEPITVFSNKDAVLEAQVKGLRWVHLRKWLMAQAYIMPIPIIEDFLIWEKRHIKPKIYFDDNRWAMYFYYHSKYVWATAPSLVEHLGWSDTTLKGYQPGHVFEPDQRKAKWFIGAEESGLSIDWSDTRAVFDNEHINGDFTQYFID